MKHIIIIIISASCILCLSLILCVFGFKSFNFIGNIIKKRQSIIHIDEYYTNNGNSYFDYSRIPLVKPFELTKNRINKKWIINTSEWNYHDGSIVSVDSIQCNDSIIAGHAKEYVYYNDNQFNQPELWFVIDLKTKQVKSFQNRNNANGIKEFDSLIHTDSIYSKYVEEGTLPWFPDSISALIKQKQQINRAK